MFRPDDIIDHRYRVVREIGRGGYGTVYLAEELGRDEVFLAGPPDDASDDDAVVLRRVAIKVLPGDRVDPRRFRAEVRSLCRLDHPNIVTFFHHGRDREPYVVMEYVDGPTLAEAELEPGPEGFKRALRRLIWIAEALAHAHARGVVHRDLKPHNVVITDGDVPRVLDFGLAWLVQPDTDASRRLGTPGFLAPELIDTDDAPCDHRVDIYSLGATMHAVFTGRSPFADSTMLATVRRQLEGDPAIDPAFPAALEPLLLRCLDRDPVRRPRTAAMVAEDLRRIALAANARQVVVVPGDDGARVDLCDSVVRSVEPFVHPVRGDGVRLRLGDGDADEKAVGAFAYAGRAMTHERRSHDALTRAWPGAEISVLGARRVHDSRGRAFLSLDGDATVILEPGFPVPVTAIVESEGVRAAACPTRWLVDEREARPSNRHLFMGALAHDVLEHLVRYAIDASDRASFGALFDRVVEGLRLKALAAGLGDADIDGLRDELAEHFEHLAGWTAPTADTRRGRVAEARRVSGRFGVDGRIDVTITDDEAVRILELKTGRTEQPSHLRQLRCYALLWDEAATSSGRRLEGWVLYSRTGRARPLDRTERGYDVLAARNDLVAMHRALSDGDTPYRPPLYGDDMTLCRDAPCRFRRDRCRRQSAVVGHRAADGAVRCVASEGDDPVPRALRDLARRYYHHMASLIEREYREASRAMGEVHRAATLARRVEERSALAGVSIESVDDLRGTARLRCAPRGVFDPGDAVVLHRSAFDDDLVAFGRVERTEPGEMVVRTDAAAALADATPDGWVVDRDVPRIGFRDMHRALYTFVASHDPRRLETLLLPHRVDSGGQRLLLEADAPARPALDEAPGGGLNPQQREAVLTALDAHDAFLVQGPPGTGKTTVIAELVAALVARGERVLLSASTNTALDTMLARVVRRGVHDVLRVGYADQIAGELSDALRAGGRRPEDHVSDTVARDAPSLEALRQRLMGVAVVAATTHRCVSSPVFEILERDVRPTDVPVGSVPIFDVAIIDEASQLTEPMTLAPIARARRFVLVGDDRQLPPVIRAADALGAHVGDTVDPELAAAGVAGLDRSLFERLKPWVPHIMLTLQYRMNDAVQAFPGAAFYGARLRPADGVGERRFDLDPATSGALDLEMQRRVDPARPSVWVDCGGEDIGHRNDVEAAEVARTAAALLLGWQGDGDARDVVGVVAPFRAQCHAIRAALREVLGERAGDVEVDTVERFQGREKEAILVSLVAREWSDFVMDPRRLNVTLTRARTKVVVFGDTAIGRRMLATWTP